MKNKFEYKFEIHQNEQFLGESVGLFCFILLLLSVVNKNVKYFGTICKGYRKTFRPFLYRYKMIKDIDRKNHSCKISRFVCLGFEKDESEVVADSFYGNGTVTFESL